MRVIGIVGKDLQGKRDVAEILVQKFFWVSCPIKSILFRWFSHIDQKLPSKEEFENLHRAGVEIVGHDFWLNILSQVIIQPLYEENPTCNVVIPDLSVEEAKWLQENDWQVWAVEKSLETIEDLSGWDNCILNNKSLDHLEATVSIMLDLMVDAETEDPPTI